MLAIIQIVTALILATEISCQLAAAEMIADKTRERGPISLLSWSLALGFIGATVIGSIDYLIVRRFLPDSAPHYAAITAGIALLASVGYALVEIFKTHSRAAYIRRRAHLITAFLLANFDEIKQPGKDFLTLKDLFEARKLAQTKAELCFLKVAGAELALANTRPLLSREALGDFTSSLERKYSRW